MEFSLVQNAGPGSRPGFGGRAESPSTAVQGLDGFQVGFTEATQRNDGPDGLNHRDGVDLRQPAVHSRCAGGARKDSG